MSGLSKQEEQGLLVLEVTKVMVVRNQIDYDAAAGFLLDVKGKIKEVEAAMEPQCKSAYDSWQTSLAMKKRYLLPYQSAESAVKGLMSAYQVEQRLKAEEAERAAREMAFKQEEKERAKLLKKAEKATAKGNEDKAAEYEMQAEMVFVPAVALDYSVGKTNGVSTSDSTEVEIIDIKEFVQWLLTSGLDLSTVLALKIGPVKQYIKLTKTNKIPGCRITKSVTVSAKAR